VEDAAGRRPGIVRIDQAEQRGTGHAMRTALPFLDGSHVLVVNGDTPLVTPDILLSFLRRGEGCDLAFLTLHLPQPGAYGRVLRRAGQVSGVVEAKDYVPALHGGDIHEVNAGVYLISLPAARRLLPRLSDGNAGGEYYLTDLIGLAVDEGLRVAGLPADTPHPLSLMGVNTPAELVRAEALLRKRQITRLLEDGVILHSPESIRVGPFARVEAGAELFGPCEIYGHTSVAFGAVVESHCLIRDSLVAAHARIRSFSHIDGARIHEHCLVGPYARLRPGAVMEENSRAGTFVEMKKARLGRGSKANHLTYLGDADVGPDVNIGAGTITCNYDGENKHPTVIGRGSFIGSNTALVAPVRLGENSLVGAGSVITKDVPPGHLGIARSRQRSVPRRKKA
jgi:bifunctional UDP-N-acetylglucosamine pyrophosphorylase/glucosamine-1-phosphate N-acetyltransferase